MRPHHHAFLGLIHVARDDRSGARLAFLEAKKRSEDRSDAYGRYVNLYSRIYLTLMDTEDPVDQLQQEALSINCGAALKGWLPLSKKR